MEPTDQLKQWLGTGSINIFGRPFAGKDTQGARLADYFSTKLIGGGEILRNSIIPPHVKKDLDSGILVPTDEYIRIVTPYLSQPEFTNKPLVLASVGRWIGEEQGVMRALETAHHPLKAVIYLDISEEEVRQRHSLVVDTNDRQRADDDAAFLDTRLAEYRTKTLPVLEAYRQLGLLITIDGVGDPDEIFREILHQLALFSQA